MNDVGFLLGKFLEVTSNKVSDDVYETHISLRIKSEQYEQELENKITNAVEYIKANYDVSTDYKKVVAVNEFIASQVYYNQDVENHKYLPDGLYQCAGYTDAVSLLLTSLGMEVGTLQGMMDTGSHAWNAVKLDGEWYYTDATGYDSDKEKNYNKYLLMTQSELDTYVTEIDSDFRASNTPYTNK